MHTQTSYRKWPHSPQQMPPHLSISFSLTPRSHKPTNTSRIVRPLHIEQKTRNHHVPYSCAQKRIITRIPRIRAGIPVQCSLSRSPNSHASVRFCRGEEKTRSLWQGHPCIHASMHPDAS
ncbi:hypothetical protein CC78DRAFT_191448 [Lojkania enalia]|uniref:Uncharacterized protein n=1 Tax=Lojkania enalia TaxID=147567 RepID=A0A9P4NBC8_9PLEO|nr:hypothetical protein CC78DRAFT_191448 [Didymosphaeria enalia]